MINDVCTDKDATCRQKILIADDSEINRAILTDMLEDEYIIIEAEDGLQAIEILDAETDIDLLLLDIMMPRMDGFEVLTVMNEKNWIEEIPVIMISAESASSSVNRAYGLGVTDYISRPFDETIVRRRVVNTLMLYGKQKKLAKMVTDQIYENEKQNNLMVNILSHIVEFRNGESGPHVLHICALTKMLLHRLIQKTDKYDLTYADISLMGTASALHDIGKITIPDEIINKPGKLTPEEFKIMQQHSMAGASMLHALPFYMNEPIVKISYEICRWHHERYDGKGYPDGLVGEEIPIAAQVVALADVYDALTSERVYKKAISHEDAIQMIMNGECGAFNPLILECLTDIADHIRAELHTDLFELTHRMEVKNISDKLFLHKELSASERTLSLLERERTKYQFLALMSREIQFEYIEATKVVTISDWGAKQLNLSKASVVPCKSLELQKIMGMDNLTKLGDLLRNTTPEAPDVQQYVQMLVDGKARWYHFICRATWLQESVPQYIGAVGKVIDIDEEHNHYLKLQHMALHDSLTQLLTHSCAIERIKQQFIDKSGSKFTLILLDLDNFKQVNDTRGHMFGDKVLCYTAERIRSCVSEDAIVGRAGGDEFLIFCEYFTSPQDLVERIFYNVCGEYGGVQISISMGVSTSETAASEYDTLFKQADQALYASKAAGCRRFSFYNDSMKNMFSAITDIDSE